MKLTTTNRPEERRRRRLRLEGERALVTGGARGIGRGIAEELAKEGASVILADLESSASAMESVCEAIRGQGGSASFVVMDVADVASTQRAYEAIEASRGGIDILVNNAGIAHVGLFSEQDPRQIAKMIDVNLTGAMVLTRLALPGMIERDKGRLVFVASIQGIAGTPGFVSYSATKGGMVRFAEALQRELSHHRGVHVTTVLPPAVKTEAFERAKTEKPKMMSWNLFPAVPIEQVAHRAVRGMIHRESLVYAGAQSALAAIGNRISHHFMGSVLESSFHEEGAK